MDADAFLLGFPGVVRCCGKACGRWRWQLTRYVKSRSRADKKLPRRPDWGGKEVFVAPIARPWRQRDAGTVGGTHAPAGGLADWASPCCQETRRLTARKVSIASIDPPEAIGPFCTGFIPDDWSTRPPGLKQSSRCPTPPRQARWGSAFHALGRGCAAVFSPWREATCRPRSGRGPAEQVRMNRNGVRHSLGEALGGHARG